MCPLSSDGTSSSAQAGPISDVVWDEIVPLAREIGQVLIVGFGEPLTNPRCLTLLKQLDALGVKTSMATNGIGLRPSICAELVQLRHLTHINVSIDSPDPQIYRAVRGADVELAFAGLRTLMACIDNAARVTVSSIIMRSTAASLAAFPRLLAQWGVRKYVVQGLLDYEASFSGEAFIPAETLAAHLEAVRRACRESGIELVLTLPQRLELELHDWAQAHSLFHRRIEPTETNTRQCSLPWETPFIDKDGAVFPCCIAAGKGAKPLGNMREQKFDSIWNGPRFDDFRASSLDGRTLPEVCRDCKVAPIGEHLFRTYAARIVPHESNLRGPTRFQLVVQNTGSAAWQGETNIRIGTSNPRDHGAACAHATWLSANRITSFREECVRPGDKASFVFEIDPLAEGQCEWFQLVAESRCWLPYTRFAIGETKVAGRFFEADGIRQAEYAHP